MIFLHGRTCERAVQRGKHMMQSCLVIVEEILDPEERAAATHNQRKTMRSNEEMARRLVPEQETTCNEAYQRPER